MSKRPQVPHSLHSELTEYSSLLRALRTSNALDLTAQLTASQAASSIVDDADDDSLISDDADYEQSGPSRALSQAPSNISSKDGSTKGKGRQRDTWTRWPLLAGDVHVPEFSLEDEVQHVAEKFFEMSRRSLPSEHVIKQDPDEDVLPSETSSEASPSEHDGDDDDGGDDVDHPDAIDETGAEDEDEDEDGDTEEDVLTPTVLRAVTTDCVVFMSRVLALLAAHVPVAEKSMQNRIHPINWETIMDVVVSHGLVDASLAESVRQRMSSIYPPTQSIAVHRVERLRTMKDELRKSLFVHDEMQRRVRSVQKVRKRGPYKQRAASVARSDR